jgi:hypothetical protein
VGETGLSLKVRQTATGVVVPVRLTPKSARDDIVGVVAFDGEAVLKVKVRALPEDGRANAALQKLMAKWLSVPQSSAKVIQGGKSRLKQIAIDGDASVLARLIAERLAALKP